MLRRVCGGLCVLGLAWTATAGAQVPSLEVTPYVGGFIPLANVVEEDDFDFGPPVGVVGFEASQDVSAALGVRLGLGLPGPLGVEGAFLYAPSDAELEASSGESTSEDAYVWAGSGRLVIELGLPAVPVGFHLNGGVAVIGRGGDAFEDVSEGETDIGGVVGIGVKLDLPGRFSLRGDIEDYLYSAQLTVADGADETELESRFQSDLVISVGLGIRVLP